MRLRYLVALLAVTFLFLQLHGLEYVQSAQSRANFTFRDFFGRSPRPHPDLKMIGFDDFSADLMR